MDPDLSELTSDFSPAPEGDAATPPVDPAESSGGGGDPPPPAATENVAQGSDAAPEGEPQINLQKLQELAAKRRAERPAETPAEPEKPATLTAEAIAAAVRDGSAEQQKLRDALKSGDINALGELAEEDPAALYERMTQRALNPDGSKAADRMAALEKEIAELKAAALPENVITAEKLQEMQAEQAYEANRRAYMTAVANEENCPTLCKVDESLRLHYGQEAQRLLVESGHEPTTENLFRIAEEIASSQLGSLIGQNRGPAAKTESGSKLPKATGDVATAAKTESGGEIDNRAASTTAASTPDPDDEDAWEQRTLSIAQRSRAH